MKSFTWIVFYVLSFAGLMAGMYFGKTKVLQKTKDAPLLNYLRYEPKTEVPDSLYTETIDSLAVVIEGLLGQMSGYVNQLRERDRTVFTQRSQIKKLTREIEQLRKRQSTYAEEKIQFSKAQDEKKLKDLTKTLSSMKVNELKVILGNFPDELVRILYDKAKKQERVKILKSLGPKRASNLLIKMAEGASKK